MEGHLFVGAEQVGLKGLEQLECLFGVIDSGDVLVACLLQNACQEQGHDWLIVHNEDIGTKKRVVCNHKIPAARQAALSG
jgi:hypothetical protein